jgi:hypothetical protein
LPWLKEGKSLASVKLGVPSKSMVLEPLCYDARVLMKDDNDKQGKNDTTHVL